MFRFLTIFAIVLFSISAVDAQQRATLRQVQTQDDTRFTSQFQNAMENGNYGQAATLVRAGQATRGSGLSSGRRTYEPVRSGASSSSNLSIAVPPDQPAEYTCNGGNCACAGASDCVAMAPICEDGTIGCNDYGCTCKEGDG
ncbi:MAG: hypothetical protein DHS20C06_16060 [Hyphobacterium sp.]|nr:MAG: hypothetical protein DHS20C06_16060 [Hyphobacterium sp.]